MKTIYAKKAVAVGLAGVSLLAGTISVNADVGKPTVSNKLMPSICFSSNSITGPSQSDVQLAIKLSRVYNGEICLFSNTSKKFPVGSSLNNNTTYTVNKKWTGKQCYIYANAVYYYLWGDFVGHGSGNYSNSYVALRNQASASYDSFVRAGVVSGSYCRTTANKDGSYNGNKGHSMIILSYNKSQIITLEGNANGKGSIEIKTRTWAEFNKQLLKDKGRRISHIVSPYTTMCPL